MRNLKKILAAICVIAMLASTLMVPALAAGFTYEKEATTLNTLGLMAGMNLGDTVTRVQGLTFAIKAAGKDAAAQALTDAEVAAVLANVVDADQIPAWGLKYAAYAVQNGFTTGVDATILPKVKFAPMQEVSGASFLVWLLKIGMGYTTVGTTNAWEVAVTDAKVLTLSQGFAFNGKAALIRDDVAGILFGAAKNGLNKDGKTFIQSLIDAGFITAKAAADAGLIAPPAPTALAVSSVSATNLKEINVVFNGKVDKDSLDNGDFDVDGQDVDSVSLKDDGVTVVVKVTDKLANEASNDITIKDVSGVNGTTIAETKLSVDVKDYDLPTATAIEFTGPQSAKITFSEPISLDDSTGAEISVDNGVYLGTVDSGWDSNTLEVDFGTDLSEGAHTILVKNFADFVPYTMISKTFSVNYADVKTAPTASISEAKQTYVKVKFDRPVKGVATGNFYQSYSSWKPLEIQDADGNVIASDSTFYGEVKLVFADVAKKAPLGNTDLDRPIPVGTANVVILGDKLEDKWGNKIKTDVTLPVSVTADTTAPSVSKITIESQKQIKIYFSEALNATEATKTANYKIVNPDGDALKSYDFGAVYNNGADDEYIVTINFDATQDPGDYTITMSGLKDAALAANIMPDTTKTFKMTDKGEIAYADIKVTCVDADDIVYVKYPEEVAITGTGSALDKGNYLWENAKLDDDCTLTMFTSKIVKIQFPKDTDLDNTTLTIGRIADKIGNLPSTFFSVNKTIHEETAPVITAVKKIAENKYELTIDQELKSVKAGGIKFDNDSTTSPAIDAVAAISYVNDGDKTKITVTVKAGFKDPGTEVLKTATALFQTVENNIKGVTGKYMGNANYLADSTDVVWSDGMAPTLVDDPHNKDNKLVYAYDSDLNGKIDHVLVGYSENLYFNTISKYTFTVAGYTVTGAGLLNAANVDAANTVLQSVPSNAIFTGTTGKFVVLTVKEIDGDNEDDTDATPAVKQNGAVQDTHENELGAQDSVDPVSFDTVYGYYHVAP